VLEGCRSGCARESRAATRSIGVIFFLLLHLLPYLFLLHVLSFAILLLLSLLIQCLFHLILVSHDNLIVLFRHLINEDLPVHEPRFRLSQFHSYFSIEHLHAITGQGSRASTQARRTVARAVSTAVVALSASRRVAMGAAAGAVEGTGAPTNSVLRLGWRRRSQEKVVGVPSHTIGQVGRL